MLSSLWKNNSYWAVLVVWYLDFESRSGEVYLIEHYMFKFVSDLRQISGLFLGYSSFLHQWDRNIVESGVGTTRYLSQKNVGMGDDIYIAFNFYVIYQ
jgi:hypothetical protein